MPRQGKRPASAPHTCLTASVLSPACSTLVSPQQCRQRAAWPHSSSDGQLGSTPVPRTSDCFPLRKGRSLCSQSTERRASALFPADTAGEGEIPPCNPAGQIRGGASAAHTLHTTSQPKVHAANPRVLLKREAHCTHGPLFV